MKYFNCAGLLIFSISLYTNVWAVSIVDKLKMIGYSNEEAVNIASGNKTRCQIDLAYELKVLGYSEEEIKNLTPNQKTLPQHHGSRPDQQKLATPGKKSALLDKAKPYLPIIRNAAQENNVKMNLILAIIKVESGFELKAASIKGAMGMMQLMPDTANDLGVKNPFDPWQNIYGGARYFSHCLKKFNDVELALAAYNAGPSVVEKWERIPPIKETQHFVKNVLFYEKEYDRLLAREL